MMEVGMLHEAHFSIALVLRIRLMHDAFPHLNNENLERGPIMRFLILCHMITFNHLSANNPHDPKTQVLDCLKCTL